MVDLETESDQAVRIDFETTEYHRNFPTVPIEIAVVTGLMYPMPEESPSVCKWLYAHEIE